ncbi:MULTISPECIES: hypothetical protein [Rhizobium]|uniref:Lipoprotein n=1 Tax=Rhizobium indicum TaxID=2583231 RepID=A0ABX6PKY3_9HYPH|nr:MULTISPECIES: hypothetical protein [Rhizobium]MBA1347941.1 hypothetical protein [Rhizobium sp. WYCCWR 11146]NYT29446.1 hypothetical protein [Rhizobium sp. WYCCWR 11128]QKK19298.1 hypothetical protein FFM53_023820 [Rhizobium indicum]
MFKFAAFFPVALGLSLASCSTVSGGIKEASHRFTAVSGERTRLHQAWHVKRDCSADTPPNVRVMTPPAHGKIDLVVQDVYPNAKGEAAKCNGIKTGGVVSYYTSAPGYVGMDKATVRESYGNGRVFDLELEFNVVR